MTTYQATAERFGTTMWQCTLEDLGHQFYAQGADRVKQEALWVLQELTGDLDPAVIIKWVK